MRRSRVLIMLQCVAAVAALVLLPVSGTLLSAFIAEWQFVLVILIAAAVLTGFGVWLPRGDSVENSASLAFVAGAYMNPQLAALCLAAALVLGLLVSRRTIDWWKLVEQSSRRGLLVAGTYMVVQLVSRVLTGGRPLIEAVRQQSGASMSVILAAVGVCAVAFVGLDLLLEQLHSSARDSNPASSVLTPVLQLRGWMVVAEMSVAALAVMIYPTMDVWGIVIATGMLLVMRQSFALLLDVRASYDATIKAVSASLQEQDPMRRMHAARVANLVAEAARRVGFRSREIEDAQYAALFHDVSQIGSDDADDETERTSSEVLAEVNLLKGALPMLQVLDGVEPERSPEEYVLIGAYLIARFSAIDSAQYVGDTVDSAIEEAAGARLYASTRKMTDRVVAQVEQAMMDGMLAEPAASERAKGEQ